MTDQTWDLVGDRSGCGPDCAGLITTWRDWVRARRRHAFAVVDCTVPVPLDAKSRNMVRKADRLYDYRQFPYNDHRQDIDRVNASMSERQGRAMTGWYTQPSQPSSPARLCAVHRDLWVGGFSRDDDDLMGYAHLVALAGTGILVSILRHGRAAAVMNGLIAHLVADYDLVRLVYLHYASASDQLTAFKHSVGFRPVMARPA